ncbi:MAG: hypothetical protein HQ477_11485 [Chloroflexi bacterium]|nr:hypothetical protein [Chloroflexota bacterium]
MTHKSKERSYKELISRVEELQAEIEILSQQAPSTMRTFVPTIALVIVYIVLAIIVSFAIFRDGDLSDQQNAQKFRTSEVESPVTEEVRNWALRQ